MGDDDHRALFGGQLTDDAEHLLRELRVKRAGRLVKAENFRIHGQRAGDGDALTLPAGKIAGIRARLIREADLFQQEHGLLLGLLTASMEHQLLRRDDVAQHRVMRKEVVILKDEPHLEAEPTQVFFRPIARRAVRAGGDHRLTVDADFAAVDGFKVVEAAQEGALARAAAADDGDDLALVHAHGHALQNFVVAVFFSDVNRLKHDLRSPFPFSRRSACQSL